MIFECFKDNQIYKKFIVVIKRILIGYEIKKDKNYGKVYFI